MKSKKRWFVTALTACLTLSLGICAEALEYDFDGVEDTEYYPSTSYESLYGAKYNYGGSNATDYQWPALPYCDGCPPNGLVARNYTFSSGARDGKGPCMDAGGNDNISLLLDWTDI